MVKFSKELEAQLIPEWKDAFVNYWQLKKHVKKIKLSRKPKQPQQVDRDFGLSIFDPIRSMVKKVAGKFQKSASSTDIMQVRRRACMFWTRKFFSSMIFSSKPKLLRFKQKGCMKT